MRKDYDRRKSEIKKMVTSQYYARKKAKRDIGFTETIRWYSCRWTSPPWPKEETDKTTYSVIMPDGHRTELKYGVAKDLIIDMLDNGWNCEGIWIENESREQTTSIDAILEKIGWDCPVWYGINDWDEGEGFWKYEYVIYKGDNAPIYFAADEIDSIPDLSNADEVYLEDDLVQDIPCPYDYPEVGTIVSYKKEDE